MNVLVATYPYAGHFNPTQPVVCELVRRGHHVVWMTGPAYEARVLQTGARFVAMSPEALVDDASIHLMEGKVTLAKVADYLRRLFVDRIPAQVHDYVGVSAAADGFVPDLLVVEFCTYAARCYMDLCGCPYATLGINPLVTLDPEIPPWGSGEQPPRSAAGRLLNRVRHALGILFFISRLSRALNQQRRALGLPPRSRWRSYADDVRSPDLHIMMTTPAFEFPRKALPKSVVFVGPLLPSWLERSAATAAEDDASAQKDGLPPWWHEMLAHPREKVVHLTQGTIAVNTDQLIRPTVEALADRGDLLVVITGRNIEAMFRGGPTADGRDDTETAAPDAAAADTRMARPANVRTAAFVPHLRLLPHVGVMVTNAGYNGVLAALSCGVPLVCAGRTEDKADVSSRVAYAGAGIDLATNAPTAAAVRAAVLRITEGGQAGDPLHLPGHDYHAAASSIRDDFARHNAPAEAVDALEALVKRKGNRGQVQPDAPATGRAKKAKKAKMTTPQAKPLRDSAEE